MASTDQSLSLRSVFQEKYSENLFRRVTFPAFSCSLASYVLSSPCTQPFRPGLAAQPTERLSRRVLALIQWRGFLSLANAQIDNELAQLVRVAGAFRSLAVASHFRSVPCRTAC